MSLPSSSRERQCDVVGGSVTWWAWGRRQAQGFANQHEGSAQGWVLRRPSGRNAGSAGTCSTFLHRSHADQSMEA